MVRIGLCKNDDCSRKDICFRYINQEGEIMEFKNICNESNNYQWLWQIKNNIEKNEEKK